MLLFLPYSLVSLSKQLHEERLKNGLLNDENFALKLQLCTSGIILKDDNAIVSDDQDNAPNKSSFQQTEKPNNCNQKKQRPDSFRPLCKVLLRRLKLPKTARWEGVNFLGSSRSCGGIYCDPGLFRRGLGSGAC